jgi:HAD superfamily hydrolase (TIGR01509 family)
VTARTTVPAAVLWDMDGTLVDTEPYWFAAEMDLVAEFGGRWTHDDARSVVGFDLLASAVELQRRGGVALEAVEIVDRMLDHVGASLAREIPWRPGARELLAALAADGIPCALVTMSWRRFADDVLRGLPEAWFSVVVTGDEVSNGKPHPEPYLRAAALLGVEPGHTVAIEDSPTGVRSALAAGCRTIGVPNAAALTPLPGLTLFPSLRSVDLAVLRSLFATGELAS